MGGPRPAHEVDGTDASPGLRYLRTTIRSPTPRSTIFPTARERRSPVNAGNDPSSASLQRGRALSPPLVVPEISRTWSSRTGSDSLGFFISR
jgi:hypothetical protein